MASASSGPPPHSPLLEYRAYAVPGIGAVSLISPPGRTGETNPESWSDGGSGDLVFSQDNRRVRLFAYDSEADNFVASDTNGVRDVFVVRREHNAGHVRGRIELVSVSSKGLRANGPSQRPSLDGSTRSAPHCVAFESAATNLDARDRSPDEDIYVRDLQQHTTRLVSAGRRDARSATVDGACRTITFESRGRVYVADVDTGRSFPLAQGYSPDQQTNGGGAAYVRRGQVYYRPFSIDRSRGRVRLRRGRELLASDDRRGRPGNGTSGEPALDDRGHYVAFTSRATNLCNQRCVGVSRDANGGTPDIFRRTLSPAAATGDTMEMASYSYSEHAQGDGRSAHPAISSDGENIVFDSQATNIGFPHGMPMPQQNGAAASVFGWIFPRQRGYGNVKLFDRRRACYVSCLSAEYRPSISSRGNYLGYTTTMSEFCVPGRERYAGDRSECPDFTDLFVIYVGPSHEGYKLG